MSEKTTLSQRKREAIIAAAISEFESKGFQKTSMDQIANTASVSKRTVYNHFASKDALFGEITAHMWQHALSATDYAYNNTLPLAAQLTAIAEQEMALLKSSRFISVSRLIFAECLHAPKTIEHTMAQMGDAENGLVKWLRAAIKDKRLNIPDIDIASAQFFGLLKAKAFWPQIVGYGQYPCPSQCELIVASSVNMFLLQYEATA